MEEDRKMTHKNRNENINKEVENIKKNNKKFWS